jgi:Amt family ammonium transporter
MGKQFFGAAVTIVYTAVATAIILYVIKAIMGLRPSKQAEMEGLDIALHGESVQ